MSGKVPHCRDCQGRIVWFRSPTGAMRPYEPKPVPASVYVGRAHPVEGGVQAWRLVELIEELQVRREVSREEAREEAFDMPWYLPHDCPNRPPLPEEESR